MTDAPAPSPRMIAPSTGHWPEAAAPGPTLPLHRLRMVMRGSARALLSAMVLTGTALAMAGPAAALSLADATSVISSIVTPEGPSVLPDGSIAAVSFMTGKVVQSVPGDPARTSVLATTGRGASGSALLDPHRLMITRMNMGKFLSQFDATDFEANDDGQILVLDLDTGALSVAFDEARHDPITGPDDITVDAAGNAWISDAVEGTALYVPADLSAITIAAMDIDGANGIALSPDGTALYMTDGENLVTFPVTGPGTLGQRRVLARLPEGSQPHGIKVQPDGSILVALGPQGIWRVSPDGLHGTVIDVGGQNVLNFAFGTGDRADTLYIVLEGDAGGKILAIDWAGAASGANG